MAFNRPIEADRVDDLGLLASLILAPFTWLLGDDHDEKDESEAKQKQDDELTEGDVTCEHPSSHHPNRVAASIVDDQPPDGPENKESSGKDVSTCTTSEEVASCTSAQGDSATEIMSDLVTALETSHITSRGPASAVLSSQSETAGSSNNSFSASYSASTFHAHESSPLPSHHSTNGGIDSHRRIVNNSNSNSRGSKKMSWSDECGNRSLVEYFEDDPAVPARSMHWSAMRRNKWKASRVSPEEGHLAAGAGRRKVRFIKSALRRSGSYSPPLSTSHGREMTAKTPGSSSSSVDSLSSLPEMGSFRSLHATRSSEDCYTPHPSDLPSKGIHSQFTADSVSSVTNGGRAVPKYGLGDGHLILGTGVSRFHGQQVEAGTGNEHREKNRKGSVLGSYNPTGTGARGDHHFLSGHISPQYGFYVNITPPTPELYAATNPLKSSEKSSRSVMQQFQYQTKYQAPSPIPEGAPGGSQAISHRYVGSLSVHGPSSNRSSTEHNSPKPSFTKNKKGMGVLLAENPYNGVWPTVPFG